MKCRLILVLCVLAVSSAGISPVRAEPPRFSIVAPGIAHAIFEVRPAVAEPFSGHAFKIDLDVAELRLVPAGDPPARRPIEQIVGPYPVVVAVNASFFDKDGRAMGLAVDDGRLMALSKQRNWGALVIDGKKGRIMLGADIKDPLAHRLIVQGIPRLLVGGKVPQLKPQIAERTAVCAEGNVVLLVVSTKGRSYGLRTVPCRSASQGRARVLGCPQPRRGSVDTTRGEAPRPGAVAIRRMGRAKRAGRCSWQEVADS
jgi:phosphodiester glycosidase